MTTAATTALNRIADALEQIAEALTPEQPQERVFVVCPSVWSRDPYVPCTRVAGHPGAHEAVLLGEPLRWGNYKDEPDLGDCYCDGGGSIRHVHADWTCTGGHKAECFDPEEECVDVAAARRERVSTHYYGDHCDPPHKEMP